MIIRTYIPQASFDQKGELINLWHAVRVMDFSKKFGESGSVLTYAFLKMKDAEAFANEKI